MRIALAILVAVLLTGCSVTTGFSKEAQQSLTSFEKALNTTAQSADKVVESMGSLETKIEKLTDKLDEVKSLKGSIDALTEELKRLEEVVRKFMGGG